MYSPFILSQLESYQVSFEYMNDNVRVATVVLLVLIDITIDVKP
jgi:hypothetical protein